MSVNDIDHEDMRELLRDQRKDLFMDMEKANQPIVKQLDTVNAHLKELNGKVADHAIKHAETHIRIDGIKAELDGIVQDRRHERRRQEDRVRDVMSSEQGDDRRVTQREVKLVVAVIAAYTGVLLTVWKVIPALQKLVGP